VAEIVPSGSPDEFRRWQAWVTDQIKLLKSSPRSSYLVQSQFVAETVSTSSSTMTPLSGGPSLSVRHGSRALVIATARIRAVDTSGLGLGAGGLISYGMAGANTFDPDSAFTRRSGVYARDSDGPTELEIGGTSAVVVTEDSLAPGETTFTVQYAAINSTALFDQRSLTVLPL
jgi:hypothetical protein